MYATEWVSSASHRPFIWATDEDIESPDSDTMGRLIAHGVTKQCIVGGVGYQWYETMKELARQDADDLSLAADAYDETTNAIWRAIHATDDVVDEPRRSMLNDYRDGCLDETYVTARRILAAVPPNQPRDHERAVHGAIVVATSRHTGRSPSAVARTLDCSQFTSYDKQSAEDLLNALTPFAEDAILEAAVAVAPTSVPTFTVQTP